MRMRMRNFSINQPTIIITFMCDAVYYILQHLWNLLQIDHSQIIRMMLTPVWMLANQVQKSKKQNLSVFGIIIIECGLINAKSSIYTLMPIMNTMGSSVDSLSDIIRLLHSRCVSFIGSSSWTLWATHSERKLRICDTVVWRVYGSLLR